MSVLYKVIFVGDDLPAIDYIILKCTRDLQPTNFKAYMRITQYSLDRAVVAGKHNA